MDENLRCEQRLPLRVKKFLTNNFVTIGISVSFLVGLLWPLPGDFLASLQFHSFPVIKIINICLICFISGLVLRTSKIQDAHSKFFGFFYTIFSIHIIWPVICFLVLKFLNLPQNFCIGFVIFCTIPCTLTSGADLVKLANGNYALAQMITIYSTFIGIFTVPFVLKIFFEYFFSKNIIHSADLLVKLLLVILVPLMFGKLLRHLHKNILRFTRNYKFQLAIISKVNLIMLIWQTISQSQKYILNIKLTCIITLIFLAVCIHMVLLLLNYAVALLGRWAEAERRTIFVLASQKTLPIAITIITFIGEGVEEGELGVILLPCIIIYFFQLYIDQYIINRIIATDLQNNIINNSNNRVNIGDIVVPPRTPTPIPYPPHPQHLEWEMEEVRNVVYVENVGDPNFQNNYNSNNLQNSNIENININRDLDQNNENLTLENIYGIDFDRKVQSVDFEREVSQHGETARTHTHTHTYSHTGNYTEILTEENLHYYNFESSKNEFGSQKISQNDIYYDKNEFYHDKKVINLKSRLSFEIYQKKQIQKVDNWLRTILSDENESENIDKNNNNQNYEGLEICTSEQNV